MKNAWDASNINADNIIEVIKATKRGKGAVVCLAIGALVFLGNSGSSEAVAALIIWVLLAAILIRSAQKSIKNKQYALAHDEHQARVGVIKRSATKCVGDYLYVIEPNETWYVPSVSLKPYAFSDLLDYDIVENGEVVWGGSVLGTAVGAMTGGITGALLGATTGMPSEVCHSLRIKISVNNINTPFIFIDLITKDTTKESKQYKQAVNDAENIVGVLAVIKARNSK